MARRSFIDGINDYVGGQNISRDYTLDDFAKLDEELLRNIDNNFEGQIEDTIVDGISEEEDEQVLRVIMTRARKAGEDYIRAKTEKVKEKLKGKLKEEQIEKNQEILLSALDKPVDEIVDLFLIKVKQTYNPRDESDRKEALGETNPMDTRGREPKSSSEQRAGICLKNVNLTNRLMTLRKIQQAANKSSKL